MADVFRNKIVLIGESDPDRDGSPTSWGGCPVSTCRQTTSRHYSTTAFTRPGGQVASYGFAFLFFLGIELVLIRFHERPLVALLWIGALSAAALMLLFVIIMFLSVYVDPLGITVTAVLLKLLHWAYDSVQPRNRTQTEWG